MPINSLIPLGIKPPEYVSPLDNAGKALRLTELVDQQRQRQALRGVLASGEQDPQKLFMSLSALGPQGIQAATSLAQLHDIQRKVAEAKVKTDAFSPENRQRFMDPGEMIPPTTVVDDEGNVNPSSQMPAQMNFPRFLQDLAGKGVIPPETYANHLAQREQARATLQANVQSRKDSLEARLLDIETRSADKALDRESRESLAKDAVQARREIAALVRATRQEPQPHFANTVNDKGEVTVHAFNRAGAIIKSTPTGGMSPSFSNSTQVSERQLRTQLDQKIKPHLDVLNAAQRFEEIRATGDSSQANQFLVAQLQQMSKTGQRAVPIAELNRALGTTFEGNDALGRIGNYVSQLATGTRTAETDRKLNALADAMSSSSAKRIGQEIQNTRAAAPAGLNADRLVGGAPRIYGRFIVTPDGQVFAGKNAADAQGKLVKMMQAAQEQGIE